MRPTYTLLLYIFRLALVGLDISLARIRQRVQQAVSQLRLQLRGEAEQNRAKLNRFSLDRLKERNNLTTQLAQLQTELDGLTLARALANRETTSLKDQVKMVTRAQTAIIRQTAEAMALQQETHKQKIARDRRYQQLKIKRMEAKVRNTGRQHKALQDKLQTPTAIPHSPQKKATSVLWKAASGLAAGLKFVGEMSTPGQAPPPIYGHGTYRSTGLGLIKQYESGTTPPTSQTYKRIGGKEPSPHLRLKNR